ncbi:hypothetical protein Q1695_011240 [Nippostrongylus brasiliensis]|nr:hypothetical protein Q1695_011240 [Nippostrongylus brasiliensis]
MFNGAPPLPPRTSSNPKVTFKGAQTWRESIGVFLSLLLCLSLFISIICLCVYYWRDRGVYEELIDYLDKTISISKINYNHLLGLYQLNDKEINALSEQRTYKTILGCYLMGDLVCYVCLVIVIILFFTTNVSKSPSNIVFWVFLGIGVLYCICEVHLFSFMLMPYAATLPNSTEQLLNHAIPHNPGGLMQMEQRLGCTFDHNLYAANQRRLNPRNTCDPQIEASFIPRFVLVLLLVLRLLPIVLCALLLAKRTPLSESVAMLIERIRPAQKKQSSQNVDKKPPQLANPPRAGGTPLPPIPSPTQIDHSISYNNAAFFATSGALGVSSSRSSDISRTDAADLFRMPLYVTRFGQFPYFFKLLTLFFSLATVICLWGAPSSPGGTSLIWFTVVVALVIDIVLIGVLALEIDRVQSPIRGFSYAALESALSLALSIFYFISIWLCINGEEFTNSSWFYFAAFTCFANFVLFAADFAIYLRIWMAEQRAARTDAATYEYPSYGSP